MWKEQPHQLLIIDFLAQMKDIKYRAQMNVIFFLPTYKLISH